jgi:hypothetical protein
MSGCTTGGSSRRAQLREEVSKYILVGERSCCSLQSAKLPHSPFICPRTPTRCLLCFVPFTDSLSFPAQRWLFKLMEECLQFRYGGGVGSRLQSPPLVVVILPSSCSNKRYDTRTATGTKVRHLRVVKQIVTSSIESRHILFSVRNSGIHCNILHSHTAFHP